MVLFAKYAPRSFPGIESLDNLYKPIHEKAATPLRIHLVDNPPLFAWVEKEYFDFTGDKGRLNHLLNEKRYLRSISNGLPGLRLVNGLSVPPSVFT